MMQANEIVADLTAALALSGVDIVQPLELDWYNRCLPDTAHSSRIPALEPAGSAALTLLIGNSAALWEPFLAACEADSAILNDPHPLECYIERSIEAAIALLMQSNLSFRLFWSHSMAELESGKGFVAMQRMAECSGLAYLDHTSHLSMHPKYGPWFSLRCAVVIDNVSYTNAQQPEPLPCPLSEMASINVKAAADLAFSRRQGGGDVPEMVDVRAGWELWLAVRDAAEPGHPQKYCRDQVLYHYTGDRNLIKTLVKKRSVESSNHE